MATIVKGETREGGPCTLQGRARTVSAPLSLAPRQYPSLLHPSPGPDIGHVCIADKELSPRLSDSILTATLSIQASVMTSPQSSKEPTFSGKGLAGDIDGLEP